MFNQGIAELAGRIVIPVAALTLAIITGLVPVAALAHCDTLDGPVVVDAREALATGSCMIPIGRNTSTVTMSHTSAPDPS